MAKTARKPGRPTLYRAAYARQVFAFSLLGMDDSGLAEMFEVNEATLNRWKAAHPEFRESISVPPVEAPKAAAPVSVADAPVIPQRLGSGDKPKSITVSLPAQDVGQDVRDRRIAHVVTGGIGGAVEA